MLKRKMAIEIDDTKTIQQNPPAFAMANPHVMPTTAHVLLSEEKNQRNSVDIILKGCNRKSCFMWLFWILHDSWLRNIESSKRVNKMFKQLVFLMLRIILIIYGEITLWRPDWFFIQCLHCKENGAKKFMGIVRPKI